MSQAQEKHLKNYAKPAFTITHVDLNVILDGKNTKVTATSKVIRNGDHQHELVLEGEQISLSSVKLNGVSANYRQHDNQLFINTDLAEFELEVITLLDPEANSSLEGLYMSDGAYCTQCEAEGFRRITYFLDRPDVLAIYTVRIEADKSAFPFLLSNGNLVDKGEMPRSGRHFVKWHDPFPKPSYLFALVAGDFDLLNDSFTTQSGREVKLQVFVDKGNLHKADHAMASLKKSMKWDETRFGLEYDLDIYMIVAVDFFNMGAMENKGLNVFNTKYVLADKASATDDDYHGIESVVGHEYFHNWTGNRVTCRDWFQLSLKEGLTVFRDQEFSSDVGSRAVNRIQAIRVMKNQQFAEDAGPMSHPIRPESVIEMNNFYTVTVYDKGAEVIRMMHTILGEDGFQAGMKCYFERHDGQAVTCDDFVNAMQDASGKDLTLFRRWYSQAGTPVVTVTDKFDADKGEYHLTVAQHVVSKGVKGQTLHIPFSIELLDSSGTSLVNKVLDVTKSIQTFVFDEISSVPTPSLLQDFSAPVKLVYDFTIEQLVHLMRYASSEVARWEASVQLVSQTIWTNIAQLQQQQVMTVDSRVIEAFRGIILDVNIDQALVAEILSIPSASALIEQVNTVDLDALAKAREFVVEELATACEDELLVRYRELANIDDAGARAFKNIALSLLCQISDVHESLVEKQYYAAQNMTDCLGALKAAATAQLACLPALLSDFESKWHSTPLVMDKWLTLQALINSDDVIENIKQLTKHNSFSFSNPNRVRSLIGAFAAANTYQFHRADGEGYRYLTKILVKLNKSNPQVASRMITPLIQFAKFDATRQELMKQCLQELKNLPDLSKDLYEKVTKSLA
ncbi:aminopeptidase N [Shewanella ulleungensis]|jgi:aminopeptidase N|uniref:Aminopeptidase N n=1 Tax=Shewanella ulleungensis TaxID=2282699 RepID=A0ABQ2QD81_9GAMM|nr:aminopeptidase N [Shewanella ulleungensis]MCL1149041.1 aminopeptidase N [Shewanella ulleungensis]GGP73973.1 aminopeptidase N [Shewanella ulleungensis]